MNTTALSYFVWENGLNAIPDIKWEIIPTAQSYKLGRGYCQLCINEKVQINAFVENLMF